MDLNGTMLCAAGAAYNIYGAIYSPKNDQLYEPQLQWMVEPVAFTGGVDYIDACFVGQNATGIIVSARGTLFSGSDYIDDWLNDLWSEPTTWSYPFTNGTLLPGKVHAGFYDAVKNVLRCRTYSWKRCRDLQSNHQVQPVSWLWGHAG